VDRTWWLPTLWNYWVRGTRQWFPSGPIDIRSTSSSRLIRTYRTKRAVLCQLDDIPVISVHLSSGDVSGGFLPVECVMFPYNSTQAKAWGNGSDTVINIAKGGLVYEIRNNDSNWAYCTHSPACRRNTSDCFNSLHLILDAGQCTGYKSHQTFVSQLGITVSY
jgi:hypothetical protein